MRRVRSLLALVLASSLTAIGIVAAVPVVAVGAAPAVTGDPPACSAFNDSVVQVVKPSNGASFVTPSSKEANGAAGYGFTDNQGEVFKASTSSGPGLVEVHRLYRSVKQDFLASADPDEYNTADGSLLSYDEQGISFYASAVPEDCLSPVVRFEKSGRHRLAAGPGRPGRARCGRLDLPGHLVLRRTARWRHPSAVPGPGSDAQPACPAGAGRRLRLHVQLRGDAGHPARGAAANGHPVHQPDRTGWSSRSRR